MIKQNTLFDTWLEDENCSYVGNCTFARGRFSIKGSIDMMWGLYLKYIREELGILIVVYRNASGYLWAMEKTDGGSNLGYSNQEGDCVDSNTFTSYDVAMSHAVNLELQFGGLEEFKNTFSGKNPNWLNYSDYLIEKSKDV